jgi:hypothetical protein
MRESVEEKVAEKRWRLAAVPGRDAPTTLAGANGGREKVEKKMKMKEEEEGDASHRLSSSIPSNVPE